MAVNSISPARLHGRPMWALGTCYMGWRNQEKYTSEFAYRLFCVRRPRTPLRRGLRHRTGPGRTSQGGCGWCRPTPSTRRWCTRWTGPWVCCSTRYARRPFNFTPMGVNPISSGSPHVRCNPMGRTCGEPDEIKKHTHPRCIATALFRGEQLDELHIADDTVVVFTSDNGGLSTSTALHAPVRVEGRSTSPQRGSSQFDLARAPARTPHGGASYV